MAPLTAYFLFCNANREAVRQRLLGEGQAKLAVTAVAKELGQLWKALSDEEKAAYRAQAEAQQQQQQQGGAADGDGQQAGEDQPPDRGTDMKAATLPVGWIKRVVGLDKEVKRCSAEALLTMSAAADTFLSAVCSKATTVAAGAKRRTVRLDDVERCVRGDKRLVSVGMTSVLAMVAEAVAASEEGKVAPPGKKPRLEKGGPATTKNNSIERAFGLA